MKKTLIVNRFPGSESTHYSDGKKTRLIGWGDSKGIYRGETPEGWFEISEIVTSDGRVFKR